jgi:muramoyltetrapeptide carboxypeptidase
MAAWESVVTGQENFMHHFSVEDSIQPLQYGKAEGPLIGGNMTLLSGIIGTEYDFNPSGHILFLEDTDVQLYQLDRKLHHFKRAGKFNGIKGLIVGEIDRLKDDPPYGYSLADQIRHLLPDADFPIVLNYPCGHGNAIVTFPIGVQVRLCVSEDDVTLKFLEPAVEIASKSPSPLEKTVLV